MKLHDIFESFSDDVAEEKVHLSYIDHEIAVTSYQLDVVTHNLKTLKIQMKAEMGPLYPTSIRQQYIQLPLLGASAENIRSNLFVPNVPENKQKIINYEKLAKKWKEIQDKLLELNTDRFNTMDHLKQAWSEKDKYHETD